MEGRGEIRREGRILDSSNGERRPNHFKQGKKQGKKLSIAETIIQFQNPMYTNDISDDFSDDLNFNAGAASGYKDVAPYSSTVTGGSISVPAIPYKPQNAPYTSGIHGHLDDTFTSTPAVGTFSLLLSVTHGNTKNYMDVPATPSFTEAVQWGSSVEYEQPQSPYSNSCDSYENIKAQRANQTDVYRVADSRVNKSATDRRLPALRLVPTHGYAEVSAHSSDIPSFAYADFTSGTDDGLHIIAAAGDNSYGVLNGTHETYLSHDRASSFY